MKKRSLLFAGEEGLIVHSDKLTYHKGRVAMITKMMIAMMMIVVMIMMMEGGITVLSSLSLLLSLSP